MLVQGVCFLFSFSSMFPFSRKHCCGHGGFQRVEATSKNRHRHNEQHSPYLCDQGTRPPSNRRLRIIFFFGSSFQEFTLIHFSGRLTYFPVIDDPSRASQRRDAEGRVMGPFSAEIQEEKHQNESAQAQEEGVHPVPPAAATFKGSFQLPVCSSTRTGPTHTKTLGIEPTCTRFRWICNSRVANISSTKSNESKSERRRGRRWLPRSKQTRSRNERQNLSLQKRWMWAYGTLRLHV